MLPSLPPPITSRSNARVKELRASLSGQARRSGDLLGLEGPNLIREAHAAGQSLQTVFVRQGNEGVLDALPGDLRTEHWAALTPEVFDSAVSTANPQGIAATWRIGEPSSESRRNESGLILENIQDPGNLGTLIRTAAAFGFGWVSVTPETANPWNPKVVRAAAGAIFRVPVLRQPIDRIVADLHTSNFRIFAAVAGFVSGPDHGYPEMAARHGVLTGRIRDGEALKECGDSDAIGKQPLDGHEYPASLSYDTDFMEPCAILIGNEGAGLTEAAKRLADEQVSIPCSVESLNAAVAGSVLMYEVMRQRTLREWARQQGLRP